MSYFETPSIWEVIKGVWPWFWGFSKLLWPAWLLIFVLAILLIIKRKLENKFSGKKKCSDCAEMIPKEAKKCSYCGKRF